MNTAVGEQLVTPIVIKPDEQAATSAISRTHTLDMAEEPPIDESVYDDVADDDDVSAWVLLAYLMRALDGRV